MYRLITALVTLGCCSIILGCSVGQTIFAKQEWSENYTQIKGTTSTSPQMIDGNLQTIGETSFPDGYQRSRGSSPASGVVITLPEKKMIRRVVLHADGLMTFNVYADKEGTPDRPNWRLVKEVKSVKTNPVDVSIPARFLTDKIRIVVLRTSDDAAANRQEQARYGGRGGRGGFGRSRAAAKINEVELYGYQPVDESKAAEQDDSREQVLDEILR